MNNLKGHDKLTKLKFTFNVPININIVNLNIPKKSVHNSTQKTKTRVYIILNKKGQEKLMYLKYTFNVPVNINISN